MTTVDFLNVGFGQSIVAYNEDRSAVLVVDGGDDRQQVFSSCRYARPLARHLDAVGISDIQLMVATHPHRDHIGGLAGAAVRRSVGQLITFFDSPRPLPKPPASAKLQNVSAALELYASLLEDLQHRGAEVILVADKTVLRCGKMEVLIHRPNGQAMARAGQLLEEYCQWGCPDVLQKLDICLNDCCMVVRLGIGPVGVLLTGDVSLEQWRDTPKAEMEAQVITLPHHGDLACLSPQLLEQIGATYGVISADAKGTWGLPSLGVEAFLASHGVRHLLFTAGGREEEFISGLRLIIKEDGGMVWSSF